MRTVHTIGAAVALLAAVISLSPAHAQTCFPPNSSQWTSNQFSPKSYNGFGPRLKACYTKCWNDIRRCVRRERLIHQATAPEHSGISNRQREQIIKTAVPTHGG